MTTGSCACCRLLSSQTVDIYDHAYCEYFSFYNPSPRHSRPLPLLYLSLSPCSFICPSSPGQTMCGQLFFFCSLSSISTIITFHPAEYGDGNNLTLLLQGDTIPL